MKHTIDCRECTTTLEFFEVVRKSLKQPILNFKGLEHYGKTLKETKLEFMFSENFEKKCPQTVKMIRDMVKRYEKNLIIQETATSHTL